MAPVPQGSFFERVARNRRINNLKAMQQTGIYAVDTDALIKELETLHASRKFRGYESKEVLASAQKKLIDASMQEASYRSNAVTIRMKCFKISALLQEQLKSATSYLHTFYATQLKNEFTTIKSRDDAIRVVLQDLYTLQHKLETVISLGDMLITDIDKTGYTLKAIVETLQIAFSRERNI